MRWCFWGQRLPGLLKVSHVSPINKLRRSWLSYTNNCSVLICICCILQLHLEPNKIACRPGPSNLDVAMGPNFGYPQKVGSIRNVTSENLPSSIPKNSSDLRKSQQFHQLGAENSTMPVNGFVSDGKISSSVQVPMKLEVPTIDTSTLDCHWTALNLPFDHHDRAMIQKRWTPDFHRIVPAEFVEMVSSVGWSYKKSPRAKGILVETPFLLVAAPSLQDKLL